MFRRVLAMTLIGIAASLGGCKSSPEQKAPTPPPTVAVSPPSTAPSVTTRPAEQVVVARVNGQAVTMDQLQAPLVEAYGLNVLLNLVQLEMARQEAARANLVVWAEDIRQERELTFRKLFKDANEKLQAKLEEAQKNNRADEAAGVQREINTQNEQLLEQFLARQRLSRPEFELVLTTNAYLRKIAMPMVAGKVTEENLRSAFGILYGENVKVRHIQCANMQEIAEAQRRLAAGEPFEQIARTMSRDRETASLGGELPAFSRNSPAVPENYRQVAFTLKPGEVSEPVQARGSYYLIKLERKIEPKAVKYEDVKEEVQREVYDRLLQSTINELRQQFAQQALRSLQIEQPVLKQQFEQRLGQRQAEAKSREQVRQEWEKARAEAEANQGTPSTAPATQEAVPAPPPAPAMAPALRTDDAAKNKAAGERPPATRSGSLPDQPAAAEPTTQPGQR